MRDACALAVNGSPFWDAEIPEGLVVANKPTRGASHAQLLGTAHNVMINNVLPGMHHTASIENRYNAAAKANGTTYEEEVQKFVEEWRIPANKFGDADHFGAFVAMFCSEQAAFVTGQSLVVDGGQTNSTF